MKKYFMACIVVLAIIVLVLGGCAKSATVPSPTPPSSTTPAAEKPKTEQETWPKEVILNGSAPTAVVYLNSAYFGDLLGKEYGIKATPGVGSSGENILKVGSGAVISGQVTGPLPLWGIMGQEDYAKAGPQPIRALQTIPPLYWNFVTLKGNNINSLADLKGKKFAGDQKGVPYLIMGIKEILAAYGLSEADVKIGAYTSPPEMLKLVETKAADAGGNVSPYPVPFFVESAMANDIVWLSLSDTVIKRVTDKFPWLNPGTMPAGTYKGQDKDFVTVSNPQSLVVGRDLPDGLVYQLLKYQFDPKYRAGFEKIHSENAKLYTLNLSVSTPLIPFHAGAVKYYKDAGAWTPQLDKWQNDWLTKLGEKR